MMKRTTDTSTTTTSSSLPGQGINNSRPKKRKYMIKRKLKSTQDGMSQLLRTKGTITLSDTVKHAPELTQAVVDAGSSLIPMLEQGANYDEKCVISSNGSNGSNNSTNRQNQTHALIVRALKRKRDEELNRLKGQGIHDTSRRPKKRKYVMTKKYKSTKRG